MRVSKRLSTTKTDLVDYLDNLGHNLPSLPNSVGSLKVSNCSLVFSVSFVNDNVDYKVMWVTNQFGSYWDYVQNHDANNPLCQPA